MGAYTRAGEQASRRVDEQTVSYQTSSTRATEPSDEQASERLCVIIYCSKDSDPLVEILFSRINIQVKSCIRHRTVLSCCRRWGWCAGSVV